MAYMMACRLIKSLFAAFSRFKGFTTGSSVAITAKRLVGLLLLVVTMKSTTPTICTPVGERLQSTGRRYMDI